MTLRRFFALLSALLSFVCLIAPGAQAADPAPQPVGETVRCPVCGMYPARYPQGMAQIVFSDASASSFDSPVEMFRFLNAMAKYDKHHSTTDIGAIYVANYGGKGWLDAKQTWFVFGSKVRGPMNDPNGPVFHHGEYHLGARHPTDVLRP